MQKLIVVRFMCDASCVCVCMYVVPSVVCHDVEQTERRSEQHFEAKYDISSAVARPETCGARDADTVPPPAIVLFCAPASVVCVSVVCVQCHHHMESQYNCTCASVVEPFPRCCRTALLYVHPICLRYYRSCSGCCYPLLFQFGHFAEQRRVSHYSYSFGLTTREWESLCKSFVHTVLNITVGFPLLL